LAFDGGLTIQRNISIKDSGGEKVSFDHGFRLDVAAGFGSREPNSLGAEIELGLPYNGTRPIAAFEGERLDVYEVPLLVNVIYIFPLHDPVRAWAGVGVGGVYGIFVGNGTSILGFNTDYTFGYQATVGIEYSLGDHW